MSKTKTFTFMGRDLVAGKDNTFSLNKTDYNKILDEEGINKDVRDAIRNADNKVTESAIKFLGEQVLAAAKDGKKEDFTLTIGSGNGKLTYGVKAEVQNRKPAVMKDGKVVEEAKPITSHAQFSMRRAVKLPTALKNSMIAEIKDDVAKALGV